MSFIETHDSYKKLRQNIAHTILRYNTIGKLIIIMVIER